MLYRRVIGFALIGVSIATFLFGFVSGITGYVVLSETDFSVSFISVISLVFLLGGLLVLSSRKSLDVIIIPGTSIEKDLRNRVNGAVKAKRRKGDKSTVYVLSGDPNLDSKYRDRTDLIYDDLGKAGINRDEVIMEDKSRDTIENVVNSFKKIEGQVEGTEIGIVSNYLHLQRLAYIIGKEQQRGNIPKKYHIHKIRTDDKIGGVGHLYEGVVMLLTRLGYELKGPKDKSIVHMPGMWIRGIYNKFREKFVVGRE